LWARDTEEGQRRLKVLRKLTRGAMAEMRTLLVELRPSTLIKADLAELLCQLGETVAGRTESRVELAISPIPPLPAEVKVALYRIAQEALNNVVKHAHANRVEIGMEAEKGAVTLCVHDDGRGFDMAGIPTGHFGLDNIRERAEGIGAELVMASVPGHGTQITVIWRQDE
jgi:signal transduction histidine kinase